MVKYRLKLNMQRRLTLLFIILTFTIFIFSINNNNHKIISEQKIFPDLSSLPGLEWWEQWDNDEGDMAFDIAIDAEDNIFIVGETDVGNVYDIVLLKYDSSGSLLWNKTWDGYDNERPYAIELDSSGNIYVTGKSGPSASLYDIFVVKFNNLGQEQWRQYWGGPDIDHGYDIALDSDYNIYVAGLYTTLTSKDICLLKYDNLGNYQWNRTLGDVDQADYGYGLSIDKKTDDIYLVGQSNGDVFLTKYDKQGIQQWNTSWGSAVNPQSAQSVIFFSNQSIYIAGDDAGNSLLMKYNNSGDLQWFKTWGDVYEQRGNSLFVDIYENSYIAGYTGSDSFIIKYNVSGHQQWEKISNRAVAEGIYLDSAGYIYITGWDTGDIFLLKYNQYLFTLGSNPEEITGTGSFQLNWTKADDVENYSVYFHNKPIDEINSSVTKLGDNITEHYFNISGLIDGKYYYKVVSYNDYGNSSSNYIRVIVDLLPSVITIISPTPNQLLGISAPDFSLGIDEPNLQETWYCFDGGNNITYTTENRFNQQEWDKIGNGSVVITFYARDRVNHINSSDLSVRKDANMPKITLHSPSDNQVFGTVSPSFAFTATDDDLVVSTWYTTLQTAGGDILYPCSSTGRIDQEEGDKFPDGETMMIRFYAQDRAGNIGITSVFVLKDPSQIISMPFFSFLTVFSITVIICLAYQKKKEI